LCAAGSLLGANTVMPRSLTVTIADDEPTVRQTLEQMLAALGHAVVGSAANGQELLDQCQRQLPELAIIDLEMPILDGLATAEDLRAISPVPVILLSGHPDFKEVVRQAEPIEVYLAKPVTLSSLQRAIERAVPHTVGG
jgi:CheY-like chemotaxis protein